MRIPNHLRVGTPATYRIVVQGCVDQMVSGWLADVQVTVDHARDGGPATIIVVPMRDQAELNGVLNGLYDLHLPVLSVEIVDSDSSGTRT